MKTMEYNQFGTLSDYKAERKKVIDTVKALRTKATGKVTTWKKAAEWHMKYSYLNGEKVLTLTITLSPTGCDWAKTGGCTMCGCYNCADFRKSIVENAQFHIAQFASAISNPEIWETAKKENCPITWIRINQEGNYTNPNEMNLYAQETILRLASRIKNVKRITIESRPQYITEDTISIFKKISSESDVELEIGMGLEAVNDVIRGVCVNKFGTKADFNNAVSLLNDNGIKPLAYILVKPPFLTEREAIIEAVSTACFATEIGFKRISFEPMTIQPYTLIDALYQKGYYKLPWLWSIIEIARQCEALNVADFGIGGVGFYPVPKSFSHNYCESEINCNERIVEAIIKFNKTHSVLCFDRLECQCHEKWQNEISVTCNEPLKERINHQLASVNNALESYSPTLLGGDCIVKNKTIIAGDSQ
ncbi:MAG: radical SAM protein [Candidatus Coproplasma sp.]